MWKSFEQFGGATPVTLFRISLGSAPWLLSTQNGTDTTSDPPGSFCLIWRSSPTSTGARVPPRRKAPRWLRSVIRLPN